MDALLTDILAEIARQDVPGYCEFSRMYQSDRAWHIAIAAEHIRKARPGKEGA